MRRRRKRRRRPRLSRAERSRRSRRARRTLLRAGIRAAGRRGFRGTVRKLRGKKGVRSPKRLAGWLKGQAKRRGWLSRKHPYVGRRRRRRRKRRR